MFNLDEKGDLLLTLVGKPLSGKSTVLTYWGKFTPAVLSKVKSGKVYFTKSRRTNL
jgi:ABC-type dipeptide/oligopeptide/nickel transport system ATPase component